MALDWTSLPNAFSLVADSANQYLTALVPLSQKLLGIAVLISGTWILLKESLSNSPRNAFAALILLLMQAAIALAAITQWPLFANIVHGLQTELSMALGGGGNAVVVALEPITKQFEPLWTFFANQKIAPPPESDSLFSGISNVAYYLAEGLKAMFVYPVTMLMSVITALLLGLIVAMLGGAIMFAEISIVIGLVAAPFMIAMNFFPLIDFTLNGLVRFLLGAIMLKFVAMLATLILGAAMNSIFSLDLSSTGTMSSRLVAMTMIMVIAAMFLYVAIKVDDIAHALMSGGVVGGPGARMTATGAQQAAVAAGGAVTSGAGRAAGAVGGAASGARAGYSAAGAGGAFKGAVGGFARGLHPAGGGKGAGSKK